MKQFKAEWQDSWLIPDREKDTISHLLTQHNALCDALEEKKVFGFSPATITIPKPGWWEEHYINGTYGTEAAQELYQEALEAASKASGITYKLSE